MFQGLAISQLPSTITYNGPGFAWEQENEKWVFMEPIIYR